MILSVDDRPTATFEALEARRRRADAAARTARVPALVAFDRAGERLLTVVELGRARARGSRARSAEGVGADLGAGADARAGRAAQACPAAPAFASRACSAARPKPPGSKVGDVITALDGNPLEASQPSDADLFATLIRQYKIGSTAKLTIVRDGKPMDVAGQARYLAAPAARDEEVRGPELRVPRARHRRRRSRVGAACRPISPACSSMRSARAAGRRSATWPTATCC